MKTEDKKKMDHAEGIELISVLSRRRHLLDVDTVSTDSFISEVSLPVFRP